MEIKEKLTSIKLDENLYHQGQIEFTKRKFSLKKLVTRSIHLFLNDEDFRIKIMNTKID